MSSRSAGNISIVSDHKGPQLPQETDLWTRPAYVMLSTNMPSGIERRRTQHRRQNSTPAAFEASSVRPLPANTSHRRHRPGMSLDLQGINNETMRAHHQGYFPQPGPSDTPISRQENSTSPQQPPVSPSKAPTEQQLKELEEHIQSVYGSCGQVFINILPTPAAKPHQPVQLTGPDSLDVVPQPQDYSNMTDINFAPSSGAMTFDFDNPDLDLGYESSSHYTSDALSPSPNSSPQQKTMPSFLEQIDEHPNQEMLFSQAPTLYPQSSMSMSGLPLSNEPYQQSTIFNDLEVDASFEYTGIAPEEVQRYISEQDPVTNKWTCLYQDCGKHFGRRENIRSHVQTHLGDRQFKCNGCGKCFVRQHDLKRHAKIHSGNKPYKCPCGAGFARQDALTRHRQRGMCCGGFPDAVRRQAKRGRPKKNRPEMEQRVEKATRTRQALASASSSVSGDSPYSDARSPSPLEGYKPAQSQSQERPRLLVESSNFSDELSSAVDPFGFNSSSPFVEDSQIATSTFTTSNSFASDIASMNILQQLTQTSHTPPMSPADQRPNSSGSANGTTVPVHSSPLKGSTTPSHSSIQSNPFSTPPTSPIAPKDELDELFNSLPDNSYSQFELEMKALGEPSAFASLDSSSYEFMNFDV
ncbi:Metallothionein expression activator [Pleosporales sp. CAS-2024a]